MEGSSWFCLLSQAPDRWSVSAANFGDGGNEKPSPISSSWQEVGIEVEGEEHLVEEEEDTHILKCR